MSSVTDQQIIDKQPEPVSLWKVLQVWMSLGLQSFGGGAATLFLIRRAVVEQQHWVSEEEFTRDWAICQIVPGINLVGMTIIIGWRTAGIAGIALALFGLLFPSITITVVLTALYASVQQLTSVQAALRGVVPATVGLGLLLSWQNARPLLASSRREGRSSFLVSILAVVGSGVAALVSNAPVILILCCAGALSGLFQWWYEHHSQGQAL